MAEQEVDDYVQRTELPAKIRDLVNSYAEKLDTFLQSLPETPGESFDSKKLKNIVYPLDDRLFSADAHYVFKPPQNVHRVGEHWSGCEIKRQRLFNVDFALEMPVECFRQKDHLNYVYHRIRALYLTYIARALSTNKELATDIEFAYHRGDPLKPLVRFRLPNSSRKNLCFQLLAFPATGKGFTLQRFGVERCNLRDNLHVGDTTPYYNQTILADMCAVKLPEFYDQCFTSNPNLSSAVRLVRQWLLARNIEHKLGHVVVAFAGELSRTGHFNPKLPVLKIFTAILNAIAESNWENEIGRFNTGTENSVELDTEKFSAAFSLNFVDCSTGLNLCYNTPLDLYQRMRYDAALAVANLSTPKFNFRRLFENIANEQYFDQIINISLNSLNVYGEINGLQNLFDNLLSSIRYTLGKRIEFAQREDISILTAWSISASPPSSSLGNRFVSIGLIVRPENAYDLLTKGPRADNEEECAKFRSHWGDKAEIRRFRNGEICEAVFWTANTVEQKRTIILEMLRHVLSINFQISSKHISSNVNCLDSLLHVDSLRFVSKQPLEYGTGEQFIDAAADTASELKKHLHNLPNLPFSILDVHGTDAIFRSSDVFPPLSMISSDRSNTAFFSKILNENAIDKKMKHVRPIHIVVRIEMNGKIEYDEDIIANQKYLYNTELGMQLAKVHNIRVRPTTDHIDAFYQGFVFRITLSIRQEITIRRELCNNAGAVRQVENFEIDQIEFRQSVLPPITNCLSTMAKKNPAYGMTCRLFKRWLAFQMVAQFFEDITCDLIVAYAFVHYNTHYPEPRSAIKGLIRVLEFLSEFDFAQNSVILNLNDMFSVEKIEEIQQIFRTERQKLPPIFFVTPFDKKLSVHTRRLPDALILNHVRNRTTKILDGLKSILTSFNAAKLLSVNDLFKPITANFDIRIELNTDFVFNKCHSVDFPSKVNITHHLYDGSKENACQVIPVIGFNPPEIFLQQITKVFSKEIIFFYDIHGGRAVYGLLKPDAFTKRSFKSAATRSVAALATGLSSTAHVEEVSLNLNSLLDDLQHLGEGLVQSIEIKSSHNLV